MSIIFDVIVVAVIVLIAVTDYRRGLINSIIGLAGTVVSAIAASMLASAFAVHIYTQFFMDNIRDTVSQALVSLPSTATALEKSEQIISSLPDYAENILALMGINSGNLFSSIDMDIVPIPEAVEGLVRTGAIKLITIVLTVILFILMVAIITFIARFVTKTISIVGLSIVNKIGGAVLGVAKAVILIMILTLVFYFIMMFLPTETTVSINNAIENTFLYKGIYNISLPEKIISLFTAV